MTTFPLVPNEHSLGTVDVALDLNCLFEAFLIPEEPTLHSTLNAFYEKKLIFTAGDAFTALLRAPNGHAGRFDALIQQYPVAQTAPGLFCLDLDGLPTGLYFVQVQVQGEVMQVLKLAVERR